MIATVVSVGPSSRPIDVINSARSARPARFAVISRPAGVRLPPVSSAMEIPAINAKRAAGRPARIFHSAVAMPRPTEEKH